MTLSTVVLLVVAGFVALNVGLAVAARRRAAALRGQPVPSLPGELGARIAQAGRALVYFSTPSCAACRAITPRMRALAEQGSPVFPVDAYAHPELARAFSVMATPTTVELAEGRVVAVHVGPPPAAVWERFTKAS